MEVTLIDQHEDALLYLKRWTDLTAILDAHAWIETARVDAGG
jgi:hypothetical protein